MKFFKSLILVNYILFALFSSFEVYAETADIYCANKDKETKWLYYNNNILKLNGEWQYLSKKINSDYRLITQYFKLNNNSLTINDVQELCIKNFGSDFQYVQASTGIFSAWIPIGIDNSNLMQSFFSLSYYCSKCLYRRTILKSINELSQKNNNIFDFMY